MGDRLDTSEQIYFNKGFLDHWTLNIEYGLVFYSYRFGTNALHDEVCF